MQAQDAISVTFLLRQICRLNLQVINAIRNLNQRFARGIYKRPSGKIYAAVIKAALGL